MGTPIPHAAGYYTTVGEITFINKLGTYSEVGRRLSPVTLLERYLEACNKRAVWEKIDAVTVIRHATKALRLARAREDGLVTTL